MKVLFLDIDGVVNSRQSLTVSRRNPTNTDIDPYMALLVNRICEATGAEIVLSSSWRHNEKDCAEINDVIFPNFIDKTPWLPTPDEYGPEYPVRGLEIRAWLANHPDVEKYAILDDDNDMCDEQLPNFFKTSFEIGLTDEIAERVIHHLS